MGPSDSVIPFAPAPKAKALNNDDSLDDAGHAVMGMLEQAATAAAENCQHAVDVAHRLSLKLRAAEDRIKDLEAESVRYRERIARAEQWLLRISHDIEQRFLERKADRSRAAPRRQSPPYGRDLDAAE